MTTSCHCSIGAQPQQSATSLGRTQKTSMPDHTAASKYAIRVHPCLSFLFRLLLCFHFLLLLPSAISSVLVVLVFSVSFTRSIARSHGGGARGAALAGDDPRIPIFAHLCILTHRDRRKRHTHPLLRSRVVGGRRRRSLRSVPCFLVSASPRLRPVPLLLLSLCSSVPPSSSSGSWLCPLPSSVFPSPRPLFACTRSQRRRNRSRPTGWLPDWRLA